MGLKGSKGSAYEGGIRVPAIIYWKGVLENSKSEQFFFSDDILPTLLTAAHINYDSTKFTGVDRWNDLITNEIRLPVNAMTGNIIISDDRALFNDKWKLYYTQNVYTNSKKTFELYDIINDPFEQNDLSKEYPDVFKSMKKTFNEAPFVLQPPYINPTTMYLYGDRFPDKPEIFEDRKLADITWQIEDSKNKSIIKITAKPYLPYKYNFINVIVFNVYVKYVLQSYLNSVVKGLKYYLESNKTVLHNQFGKHIWYS